MATPNQRKTQEVFYYTPDPHQDTEGAPEVNFTDADRAAMRVYLQRSEVRISTLHRIATAFVSGAGLLLLIPIFFKDVIDQIIQILLEKTDNQFEGLGDVGGILLTLVMVGLLAYPIILSLSIPLYGVYLLLKDLIQFYFSVYIPGFDDSTIHPTFSLAPLSFSPDESLPVKREVMRYQYQPDKINFMIPFSEERRGRYFDEMITKTNGEIIPPNRRLEELEAMGVLPKNRHEQNINRYNTALGITGALDRTLAQEVAVTEMLLVRNVMYLRRLVLRYAKVFLMFIWTMFISFMMLPLLKDDRFPVFVILGLAYSAWAIAVMPILKTPLGWLYRHRGGDVDLNAVDAQLVLLEKGVERFIHLGIISALAGLTLAGLGLVV